MTRSNGRALKERVSQNVHIATPDIKSMAALTLLGRQYFSMDRSIYTDYRMHKVRLKWIKSLPLDEAGGLTCAICGRKGLKTYNHESIGSKKYMATVDHIIEIGKGGKWNDPSNFQIACYICNSKKNEVLPKNKI